MAALHDPPADAPPSVGRSLYLKGSVERILALCSASPGTDPQRVHAAAADLAARGLRVLAMARAEWAADPASLTPAEVEGGSLKPVFLGLQGMMDPPRPEAIEAVRACQAAGIRVKMITGDHARTAASIAALIGIDGASSAPGAAQVRALTGAELAKVPDDALPATAESTPAFARMTPEQKLRLVKALQHGVDGRGLQGGQVVLGGIDPLLHGRTVGGRRRGPVLQLGEGRLRNGLVLLHRRELLLDPGLPRLRVGEGLVGRVHGL
ncbi:MAG: HAD family hydrolase, partial [Gemmobacter sp.]